MRRTDRQARRPAATERVYGLEAVLAVLRRQPERVLKIAHTKSVRASLGPLLREAARRRIAYRELDDEELARIAGSVHHEGICLLVRTREDASLTELAALTQPKGLLLALDGVSNPHNVGAVLRSAAFFGTKGLLLAARDRELLTPAAIRVAEGGAEHVAIARVAELAPALRALNALGLTVIGADGHARASLAGLRWPERTLLVLGSEDSGLSPAVQKCCERRVQITGSGALESLNVSVAAGVFLASYAATHA
jgi:TrmH RNA methyltransferase